MIISCWKIQSIGERIYNQININWTKWITEVDLEGFQPSFWGTWCAFHGVQLNYCSICLTPLKSRSSPFKQAKVSKQESNFKRFPHLFSSLFIRTTLLLNLSHIRIYKIKLFIWQRSIRVDTPKVSLSEQYCYWPKVMMQTCWLKVGSNSPKSLICYVPDTEEEQSSVCSGH